MPPLVLQSRLPRPPWLDPAVWRLPGVQPLEPADWLIRDDAFAGQMALRDRLIAERPGEVHQLLPPAAPAARECYEAVLASLRQDPEYRFSDGVIRRPDGVRVPLDPDAPLLTLGRLVQPDICLMQRHDEGHILSGAILCFPAQWTLAEKIGRGMSAIHTPVQRYDVEMERRVQRLFDAMRPGQFLWRANAILYEAGELFTPKAESLPDRSVTLGSARFVRSERQVLHKLPETGAVVFTIHTYMVPIDRLSEEARRRLPDLLH
ncbi:MAG: DUF3445 domain-containing protein [Silicimonas sp.]|nr:DUF3445 domain-containing protein [Silicimonas sp.]